VSDQEGDDPLSKSMMPPPWDQEQTHRTNDNSPTNNPEQIGLPHRRRKHDYRGANQQAESLFCIVRSGRTRERCEKAFSYRRFCEGNPCETNEEEAEHHDDYFGKYTHYHDKRCLMLRREV
jgi:hypothetical protein